VKTFSPAKTLPAFVELPKLNKGDQVSIVASSAQIAAQFSHVYDFGIQRIKDIFGLNPVELPTTRASGSSLQDRARDLMAAFSDPRSKAVISLIGGHEQILLLPFLDSAVFKNNPKPFFGYSDNTNLCLYLWSLGIPCYYGGCVFTEYAMCGKLHPYTERYLRLALFENEEVAISPAEEFSDQDLSWAEPGNLRQGYEFERNPGWVWDGCKSGEGILWGGCLEILGMQLQVSRWLPSPEAVRGTILCLETSEVIPQPWYIFEVMVGLGERGYLSELSGLLVGRPKARALFGKQPPADAREKYRSEQRRVILKEFRRYNPSAPVVMNMDFGHTKPQIPLPFGKMARINAVGREVRLTF
jgi:muramoyltetrapeptide carboxypeptidase LdcA involved in peptidoglycan recycling